MDHNGVAVYLCGGEGVYRNFISDDSDRFVFISSAYGECDGCSFGSFDLRDGFVWIAIFSDTIVIDSGDAISCFDTSFGSRRTCYSR